MKIIYRTFIISAVFFLLTFLSGCSEEDAGGTGPTLSVNYDGNGNTGGSVPVDNNSYEEGDTVTVLGNSGNLSKENDVFYGWNTQSDMQGIPYSENSTFTMGSSDITLYTRWLWTRLSGISGKQTNGEAISVDSQGNIYITGTTFGSLDGETFTGYCNVFVTKYNPNGVKQWTRLSASTDGVLGYGITTDSEGNVYVSGTADGSMDGQTLTGICDVFVIKYNSSGVKQWTRLSGVSFEYTDGRGIAADSQGNVYVVGYTEGALGGETINGDCDVFVIKYNSSGVKQWTRLSGTIGEYTEGYGITVDSQDNVYITGIANDNLDGETISGDCDVFVIKYNSSGVKQWTRLSGVFDTDTEGYGIDTDSQGNVYVTGITEGSLDSETLNGESDAFVIKYNSSGVKQWTKLSGASGVYTEGYGISTDSDGNVYITGDTDGSLDGETISGNWDTFVIMYNNSGIKQWTGLSGVSGKNTFGRGISADSSSNIYVAGSTTGSLDSEILTGTRDLYVTTRLNN